MIPVKLGDGVAFRIRVDLTKWVDEGLLVKAPKPGLSLLCALCTSGSLDVNGTRFSRAPVDTNGTDRVPWEVQLKAYR